MANKELGISILDGAFNPELKDVAIDFAEIGLDHLLDKGLFKEVPVLKTITACRKTWEAINDRIFLTKVIKLLTACQKITEAEWSEFQNNHMNSQEDTRRLGETVVLILDRLDDLDKPAMLAAALAAFVRGKVSWETFRRLSTAIDLGFVDDLKVFMRSTDLSSEEMVSLYPSLSRAGLAHLQGPMMNGQGGIGPIRYQLAETGEVFKRCMKGEL